jgi:hypothetical protein
MLDKGKCLISEDGLVGDVGFEPTTSAVKAGKCVFSRPHVFVSH